MMVVSAPLAIGQPTGHCQAYLSCCIISNHLMLVSNMKMMALFYFILLYKYMKINTYLNY